MSLLDGNLGKLISGEEAARSYQCAYEVQARLVERQRKGQDQILKENYHLQNVLAKSVMRLLDDNPEMKKEFFEIMDDVIAEGIE